jgi:hypothetical protein
MFFSFFSFLVFSLFFFLLNFQTFRKLSQPVTYNNTCAGQPQPLLKWNVDSLTAANAGLPGVTDPAETIAQVTRLMHA